ncbi:type II toxin-antitoxin system toxin DNA ADP-ribosyl transferase DarT [Desulfarculus baarsii]
MHDQGSRAIAPHFAGLLDGIVQVTVNGPQNTKIYHIVHVDRIPSIIANGGLCCDSYVIRNSLTGTTIGMSSIKQRRLTELQIPIYPGLFVGDCVPFYFCPRSIMLFLIHRGNHLELGYRGGQSPIVHLEADLVQTVTWAQSSGRRWAFSLSNAGARYAEFRCNLNQLCDISWNAVNADKWSGQGVDTAIKEGKQAEFLVEGFFPWHLVTRIGIQSNLIYQQLISSMRPSSHQPSIEIISEWYY